ncbi:hypothetical protein D1007_46100 [Hordeum vulgare]|nr:hypothetical protein D1007_46100 [Hordeum vulgare]
MAQETPTQSELDSSTQSDLESSCPGYMAQETSARIVVSSAMTEPVVASLGRQVSESPEANQQARVRVRPRPGFPSLGPGRATRVPLSATPRLAMAGRGSKQSASSRQSGQNPVQGNPPAPKPLGSIPAQAGPSQVPVQTGKTPIGVPGQKDSAPARPHRGRWGDEGANAYSEGHYRGNASSGGGRGFAWQNNGFHAPPGQFVPGPSGPAYPRRGGFRQNWMGRGGGRKPKPPIPSPEQPSHPMDSVVASTVVTTKEVDAIPQTDQTLAAHVRCRQEEEDIHSAWANSSSKKESANLAAPENISVAYGVEPAGVGDTQPGSITAAVEVPQKGSQDFTYMHEGGSVGDGSNFSFVGPDAKTVVDELQQCTYVCNTEAMLNMHDVGYGGRGSGLSRADPDTNTKDNVTIQERANIGGGHKGDAPTDAQPVDGSLELAGSLKDTACLPMAATEFTPTAVAPNSSLISEEDVIAFGEVYFIHCGAVWPEVWPSRNRRNTRS